MRVGRLWFIQVMDIKIGQINLGRGRNAWAVMERKCRERDWDIVLVQEPFRKGDGVRGYIRYRGNEEDKVDVLVKSDIKGVLRSQYSDMNCLEVYLPDLLLSVVSTYVEPWAGISKADKVLRRHGHEEERVLVGGDFNAKHVI